MGERKPLAGWAWEDEVTRILQTGQMATFKVFISRENGNYWWECHESGGPWPYDDRLFDHTADALIAAEDAARAMVADMAKALGGSVTWADDQEDEVIFDAFRKRYDGALRGMAAHPVGDAQEVSE